jgi:zinc protease
VLEELRGLAERPVTDEELRLALTAVAAAPVAAFRSSRETARTWLLDDFVGRPHSLWSGLRQRVAQVTGDDVRAAARRHLRMDRLTVLLVGPAGALDTTALERVAGRPLERLPEAGAP